ncbi:MAG: ribosome recycling factor [Planctomycetes bacterium]|nr:ribosome recycling factor [Planctomycetota bacterium]MCP4839572.1 ribosome recycling factor [Planctomycetota bacterium]
MADAITKETRARMSKSIEYLQKELRGIRTGRASTALLEYLKVEAYGTLVDLRDVAAISVPEATQLLVKPFDPTLKNGIAKSIESAELGLNPQVEGESIRINLPPPSAERRTQLSGQVRKIAEETRVAIRNERRDAMKQIDARVKDKSDSLSEDMGKNFKQEVEDLTKSKISEVDSHSAEKTTEIETL